jgi:sugar transferase (PEP-CTERM/EpsH1 system associated)
MRILWLNANVLLPLDKGGKLRTWHLIRHLARRHHITYLSFIEPGAPPEVVEGMREVCSQVETVTRAEVAKGGAAFYADVLRYLFDRLPYAVAKYRSSEFARRVRALVDAGPFDLVLCDFLVPAVNLPRTLPCPAVLFTHNVEADIWRRHAEMQSGVTRRMLFRAQWRRMLRFERDTLARFGLVLAVSEADRDTFARLYGNGVAGQVFVVKTGVDTGYFSPAREPARPGRLVFTGSMDWLPNEDAMLYFVRDILPRIRQQEPGVTLSIVGRAPTPAVQALAREAGIDVTGRVDDVRPHVAQAMVYVVPIRIGGGTRLKIFEAMAMGKAVVSTTVGAEGLPVTPGADILIEDPPDRFARAVIDLLRDEVRRTRLERRARELVVNQYDWTAVGRDLERALASFAQASGLGEGPEIRPATPEAADDAPEAVPAKAAAR